MEKKLKELRELYDRESEANKDFINSIICFLLGAIKSDSARELSNYILPWAESKLREIIEVIGDTGFNC